MPQLEAKDLLLLALGLVIGIPITLAVNLFTPKAQAWWATTSSHRMRKRIAALEGELRRLEAQANQTDRELVIGLFRKLFLALLWVMTTLFFSTLAVADMMIDLTYAQLGMNRPSIAWLRGVSFLLNIFVGGWLTITRIELSKLTAKGLEQSKARAQAELERFRTHIDS